jgi:hypothetical protein
MPWLVETLHIPLIKDPGNVYLNYDGLVLDSKVEMSVLLSKVGVMTPENLKLI